MRKMADATSIGGGGNKHAALWERMRAQKLGRPQMIHRRKLPQETQKEERDISMQVTMSPENSTHQQEEDDESLVGVKISNDTSMTNDASNHKEMDTTDTNEPNAFSLGTSFISSSTVEDAIVESEHTVTLLATPAAKASSSQGIMPNGFTPAVLYKNWNQQQQQHDVEEKENLELLQQSMISDDSCQKDTTPDKLIPMESSSPSSCDMLLSSSPASPLTAMRSNSMHQALEETNDYVARIQQLEHALRQAQQQQGNTTTTARGQSTPSNFSTTPSTTTPSPLLERNKTLIKEVRFAEQTCVELSQEKAALEQELQGLGTQLQTCKEETEGLHEKLLASNRTCATLESEKNTLENSLQQERHERMLLQEQVVSLQHDTTSSTSIVKEHQESNNNNSDAVSSPTSRVLAKTLQTQLERGYTDSDKLVELETKLATSQQALWETRHELQLALSSTKHETSGSSDLNDSTYSNGTVELELAKTHAKLASVSKELQLARVAESSARHALSQTKLELDRLTTQQASGMVSTRNDTHEKVDELQATVEQLTRECSNHDTAAMEASNTIRALEYELSLAKQEIVVQRERFQDEFVKMTQAAVATVEHESELLNQKVSSRTEHFESRIATLTRTVQHLQDSLDFESETGSTRSSSSSMEEGGDGLANESPSKATAGQPKTDGDSEGAVMNATFHQSQSDTRSIHEEMILEQMEEARVVDAQADPNVGHDLFEDLSFIADLSHLYEDLSGLLMHDPTSPTRGANANAKVATGTPAAGAMRPVDASPARKPPIQIRLESVEEDFVKLKTILERLQNVVTADGNIHCNGAIEEQASVFKSLERKLGDLADEAGKTEAERRQLNVAVLEMSKEFNRCQAELKETIVALEESKKAEANAKSEIQMTLVKLEEKECAISVLEDEKDRLSLAVQQLSESSNHLLQQQEETKVDHDTLVTATKHIEMLQQKVESKSRLLDESNRQSNDLFAKVETLEANIGKLKVKKFEIQAKYDDASSLLRALSREREQHKQELVSAKANVSKRGHELKLATEAMEAQKEELEILQTEYTKAIERSNKLSNTVDALTTERNELLSEIQELKNSVATANSELEYLKVSYITCNDQLADVSEKNANKDKLVAQFQSSNRAAKEAIATYERRISNLNMELHKTHADRSVLQEQLTAMEKELRETAADFISYKNGMEAKLSERDDLIEAVQSTTEALKSTYEHKLSSLSTEHESMLDEVNQAVNALMNEFLAAYADSLGSLSQIGYEFDGGDLNLGSRELPWNQSLKAISSHLPQWKQLVHECIHVIDDYQDRLHQAEEKVGDLVNTAAILEDSGAKMEDKLLAHQHHSDTLADKLTDAEMELAKSMREAAEMSQTFASTKRELEHVSKLLANQTELKERTNDLIADREEAEVRVAEMKRVITSLEERLKSSVGEYAHLRRQMQEKESQNVSLEQKCERLRDYIRKLTSKCEEWAEYAEKQSKRIQQAKTRQREHVPVSNASVENTPRNMASSELVDESKWSAERRMLDRVANLAGEEDLDFGLK